MKFSELFDINEIKDALYDALLSALKDFSNTENNADVYAIALDCQTDGTVWLRFHNNATFSKTAGEYADKWGYGDSDIYGFHALQYHVGDFESITYSGDEDFVAKNRKIAEFFDVYTLVLCGMGYAESGIVRELTQLQPTDNGVTFDVMQSPPPPESYFWSELVVPEEKKKEYDEARDVFAAMFWDIVYDCTLRLKENIGFINKTENFIIFAVDHDMSEEQTEISMRKSIDEELFAKLLSIHGKDDTN